jgi:hypothetical protein
MFGATVEHLNDIYENEAKSLEPWQDSPGEITLDDWTEYLGKWEYVSQARVLLLTDLNHLPAISERTLISSRINLFDSDMTGKLYWHTSFTKANLH